MSELARRLMAPGKGRSMSEDEVQFGFNPIDELRRTVNTRSFTPEQAAQNRKASLWEALSVLPGPGNAISAHDAYKGAGDAYNAFAAGDYKGGALASALAGLSGAGAVFGLPVGKHAKGAAESGKRALFSGGGSTTKTAAAPGKPIYMINDVNEGTHFDNVVEYMERAGAPHISVVDMGDHFMALEGSKRLMAAKKLGLAPELSVVKSTDTVNPLDYDWGHNYALDYLHEPGLSAGDIAQILRDTSQNTSVSFPGIK